MPGQRYESVKGGMLTASTLETRSVPVCKPSGRPGVEMESWRLSSFIQGAEKEENGAGNAGKPLCGRETWSV